jgi:hypothetical protein
VKNTITFTADLKTMYSSITKNKCKCGCGRWPSLGYNGYFYSHAPQEIIDKVGTKKQVAQKNKNKKAALSRKLHEAQNVVSGAELNRWFDDRRKEMTGVCANCGAKSCKESDDFFRFSIAHILPKAYFPSVKTHESNWIELCFWGSGSCHSQMDNKMLDLIDMACFDTIITRFVEMYPSVAEKEKRRIPPVLMQYIEVEK